MNWTEAFSAVDNARETIESSSALLRGTARLLRGHLRGLDLGGDILRDLKRELTGFNAHTCEWEPK